MIRRMRLTFQEKGVNDFQCYTWYGSAYMLLKAVYVSRQALCSPATNAVHLAGSPLRFDMHLCSLPFAPCQLVFNRIHPFKPNLRTIRVENIPRQGRGVQSEKTIPERKQGPCS